MIADRLARIRVLFHGQRRYDLAERALREHPELLVDNAEAHAMLGACACKRKNFEEARSHLRKALEIDPEYADAFYWLADATESLSEKEALVREAIRLRSDAAEYHAFLAQVLLSRNKSSKALLEIEKALSIDPNNIYCLHVKAEILIHCKKKSEAIVALNRALLINPLDAHTHVLLYSAKARTLPRDAEQHLKTAMQLAPNNLGDMKYCLAVRARRAEVATIWFIVKCFLGVCIFTILIDVIQRFGLWIINK